MSFSRFNFKKEILSRLAELGFTQPTEVQEKVIPLAAQGKHVVFTSKTGSGKTMAFTLSFLGKLNRKLGIQLIVLVPTRELAIQVGKEMARLSEPLQINVGVLYGGRDISGDYRTLSRKLHILVGTPGRVIQHINEKHLIVGDTKYVVFDESDQMFDNGFYKDCCYLLQRVSKDVQVLLSSATITPKVREFIDEQIGHYELLTIGLTIPTTIYQEKYYVEIKQKNPLLLDIFTRKKPKRTLVFCNTKAKVQSVADFLSHHNFNAKALTSDDEQKTRIERLNLFKEGKIDVLVATDVAARGLHIEKVKQVINYDIPNREEFYVHRIGRTGRGEAKGRAVSFVCPEDVERLGNIEKFYNVEMRNATKE